MVKQRRRSTASIPRKRHAHTTLPDVIKIGFYPVCDAAPILIAQHLGFFRKNGLNVILKKEIGWATLQKKLENGQFQAAHGPASFLFQPWQNSPSPNLKLQTAYILNVQGTAITLSSHFLSLGVKNGIQLSQYLENEDRDKILKIGVASHFSAHKILVLDWLEKCKIPIDIVEFVVLPPRQMPRNLSSHNIDAFCADEPWNNYCVLQGTGFCEVTSPEFLHHQHPEKVLLTTRLFAKKNAETLAAMTKAIHQAAILCDKPEYNRDVAKILSRHLDVEPAIIESSFSSVYAFGAERNRAQKKFLHFTGEIVNRPTLEKGEWLKDGLVKHGLIPAQNAPSRREINAIFRNDIYNEIFES